MIEVMADHVKTQIEAQGGAAALIPQHGFTWDMGDQQAFTVSSETSSPISHQITWGVLSDVIEGLQLFLVKGKRPRECYFRVEKVIGGKYVYAGRGMLVQRSQGGGVRGIAES